MLVRHSNDLYSWGENPAHYGAKAKQLALLDGLKDLGIPAFRTAARKSCVSNYQIEMAIAEFRAKSQNVTRDDSRPGDDDIDYQGDSPSDINGTVAHKTL